MKIKKTKGWAIVEKETGRILQVFTYKPSWSFNREYGDYYVARVVIH